MEEEEKNENKDNDIKEDLIDISNDRDSNVKLGRITDTSLDKIEEKKKKPKSKKVSSIQTIFSIWNTMIGSTIISLPYNVYCAGIIPTIVIGLLYGFICYFTCYIVVKLGGKEEEYAKVVYNYFDYGFGKRFAKIGKVLQITFNLMINIGATMIYFLIINQNLYPCICLLLRFFGIKLDEDDLTPYFDKFSIFYCALIVSIVVFPLTILKEMNRLVKFNSYGFFFVSSLLIFVIYNGIKSLIQDKFHFEYKENIKGINDRYLLLFGQNPGIIVGTLSLGLFSHSVILPLLKNNKKPENNQRDLFIGYVLVTFTYIIIGIMGYIGFSGSEFDTDFKENWFRFFKSDNYFILVLRILNIIQLISIFPILFFVVRTQLFSTFFEKYLKSTFHIVIFSIFLFIICLVVLIFCNDILAYFIGYIGAATSLVLVYSISPITDMIYYYIRHQTKDEVLKIIEKKSKEDPNTNEEERIKRIFPDNLKEPVPLKPVKAFFFYLSMMLIIMIGITNLILQFVKVNFFKVKIEKS